MTRIECQSCGDVLAVPDSVPEGGELACARCGLVLRNVEAARSFRWAAVDPYVRAHGASRMNLWGGLLGAFLWVPILAVMLAVKGQFDAGMIAALGGPYAAMLLWFGKRRARAPAALWVHASWMIMGAYVVYVWAILQAVPRWADLFLSSAVPPLPHAALAPLGAFGAIALAVGALNAWLYRRRGQRVPRVRGTPSATGREAAE